MKKLITSIFILTVFQLFAQVEKIDTICSEMDELIQQSIEEDIPQIAPSITIQTELMERAIGPVEHTMTIYFDEEEREFVANGTDETSWENIATRRKIIFREQSVSYDITYTYYYSEKGNLIKYVRDEKGYECVIKTYYFEGETVIKVSSQTQKSNKCHEEEEADTYERTSITEDDQRIGYAILYESNRLGGILRETYQAIKD